MQAQKDYAILLQRLMVDVGLFRDVLDGMELAAHMNKRQLAAYKRFMAFQEQHGNIERWPAGPGGNPELDQFFQERLPEAMHRLNGRQRFFVYLMAKRGGEAPRTALKEFTSLFYDEFPGIVGSPAQLAEAELETLGFLERQRDERLRLAEPYFTRLQGVPIP